MKQLTKAEEEVMQQLWQLEKCNVAAIIEQLPEPKPAYNTVSTIVRILESKGFVGHEKEGKGYLYFPIVKKSDYSNQSINKLVDGYFQGSFKSMVSFFMKKNDMSLSELESIMQDIKKGSGPEGINKKNN
ncbi:BlaI/MecI/CopY family transcriptional regulator [Zobellia galactanivorans]|uniref:BlaI-type transcriptional repressor n=1 Tax=Zobellia galactanivorans (strain DSM 12802 / CCUG 47099 / CIP 106680 / NCIMB 13871 / Dsij) TaxID=63186 RepID=G0L5Q8_ZOBGA|nr:MULTISPECIES: BlaI/MecI/CopY family transcriptional regulator [Zobellia]MBU3026208.1 BlaI/MecI/CopY family transcriptional regulator [Zobellia galactanivorans]MDO6807314.1 BlaI/MecI/CopY family transcriptional regulator [Zobellia galactanivorans]OWW27285.1 CopY family transcriptional repressor [Zobellia sp. OII3]CAZ96425.1 BlaI-type transcriptional repressor [Zobellia galactanivorans]